MSLSMHDTRPDVALDAIQSHRGPVLVDLDETLYLRNSTQDFIGSAWPHPLAFLLMKLLDLLKPWRLTGGVQTQDVWRVGVIVVLMPWSLLAWTRKARRLGAEFSNQRLVQVLNASTAPQTVVTLGFRPIVAPLVAAMGLRQARVVAMSVWGFGERRRGKRARVAAVIGEAAVREALLVTDSLDDRDLLEVCLRPLRVIWPQARYRDAFESLYLPGLYISQVKRPGVRYIYRSIVSDEFSIWVLASITLVSQPLLHVAGLALLSMSFWAIYETGYVDNDQIGARHEKDPVLTQQFFESKVRTSTLLAWVWAAGCGLGGLLLLRWPSAPPIPDVLAWTGVLLLTYFWFRLYNRLDKRTRIWLFAGLQALRSMSFVAVVSVTLVGAAALLAHVLARWVPYYSYRLTGGEWKDGEVGSSRLLFFVLICGALMPVVGWQPFWSPVGLILLFWFAFKARRELVRSFRDAHFITERKSTKPISSAERRMVTRIAPPSKETPGLSG